MIWLLLLLVPVIFSVGFLAGCWYSTGGRCRRGGYMPPFRGLEAQEFRPPYTGER